MFCRSAGKPNFAVNRLSKENRVGVDRRVALVHEGNDAAAVSAAAQVGTRLFRSEIRQMMLDRRAYPFADFASPVSRVAIAALTVLQIPVASLAYLPVFVHQASPGAKLLDALINHHRRRDGAEKHVLHECGWIHRRRRFLGMANSSHPRSKKKAITFLAPVQAIDTETIDGENEAAVPFIPESERENAIQQFDEGGSTLLIEMGHQFSRCESSGIEVSCFEQPGKFRAIQ